MDRVADQVEKTVRTTVDKIKRKSLISTGCDEIDNSTITQEEQPTVDDNCNNNNITTTINSPPPPSFTLLAESIDPEEEVPLLQKEKEEEQQQQEVLPSPILEEPMEEVVDDPIELQLKQLEDMGFRDREKNRQLLEKYNGDTVDTILELLNNL